MVYLPTEQTMIALIGNVKLLRLSRFSCQDKAAVKETLLSYTTEPNEQTYQSTVIWLSIMKRQVDNCSHCSGTNIGQTSDKDRTNQDTTNRLSKI